MSEQPTTLVQAGGRVAENIVSGLTGTPTLLLIILLNVAMIFAGAYYLAKLETNRTNTTNQVAELLRMCIVNYREEANEMQ